MLNVEDLREDVKELIQLEQQAVRQHNKNFLISEIRRLETQIAKLTDNTPAPVSASVPSQVTSAGLPSVKLTTYAFDQSDKFVKLYVTVPSLDQEQAQNVFVTFKPKSVSLICKNIAGKNYELEIIGLLKPVNPDESTFKVKKETVLLMLRKASEGVNWDCVTEQEAKSKGQKSKTPKFDDKEDPSAGLMKMMKDMYDEGDDEMKRTIRKAWCEAQEKRDKKGFGSDDF